MNFSSHLKDSYFWSYVFVRNKVSQSDMPEVSQSHESIRSTGYSDQPEGGQVRSVMTWISFNVVSVAFFLMYIELMLRKQLSNPRNNHAKETLRDCDDWTWKISMTFNRNQNKQNKKLVDRDTSDLIPLNTNTNISSLYNHPLCNHVWQSIEACWTIVSPIQQCCCWHEDVE